MQVATVPVKSSLSSKVNWIAGLTSLLALLTETTNALQDLLPFLSPTQQHYVTIAIIVLGGLATIITRTFFTTAVTAASMKGNMP